MTTTADAQQASRASKQLCRSGRQSRDTRQDPEHSRLARAIAPNNPNHFSRRNLKTDVTQRPNHIAAIAVPSSGKLHRTIDRTLDCFTQSRQYGFSRSQKILLADILDFDNWSHEYSG